MYAIIRLYKNSYTGLSRSSWLLAFIAFINRSGMMVLPFIGLYLTEDLHFSVQQAGVILSFFGIGSVIGSYIGGYLSDRIGYFRIVLWSLLFGGVAYFSLIFLHTFYQLCAGVLLVTIITDSLRPAMSGSITSYNSGENTTRSVSLLRMAINLGASIGPALGGLLAVIGYFWIFIGDGISSILAGIVYYFYFRNGKNRNTYNVESIETDLTEINKKPETSKKPYADYLFLLFTFLATCYAIVFLQLFNTVPLYYRNVRHLSEPNIGFLLALNGLLVFILEMVLVYVLGRKYFIGSIIIIGVLFCAAGMLLLNFIESQWVLYFSMFLLSISEIMVMPFMMTIALSRSDKTNKGMYIGYYTMGWGIAFIIAPLLGTFLVHHFNYEILFWVMAAICLCICVGIYFLVQKMYSKNILGFAENAV